MIFYAKERAEENKIYNAYFKNADWALFDIEGLKGSFDLIFAHLTPAICDTLEKMIDCSKRHCLMVKPASRKDSIFDRIKEIAGIEIVKDI